MRPKLLILDGSAMISTAYYAVLPNEVKFAKTEEEKEKARKEYLDRRGAPESFRW